MPTKAEATTERWVNDLGQEFEADSTWIWCNTCGFAWDKKHKMEEPKNERCPICTIDVLERVAGAAHLLRIFVKGLRDRPPFSIGQVPPSEDLREAKRLNKELDAALEEWKAIE